MNTAITTKIPADVIWILEQLQMQGYESYIVGGCVRDLLLDRSPNDYDVTTNATPEQIIEVFEKTDRRVVYENNFGTVGIINKELGQNDTTYEIEITPYRTESGYSDKRRPDDIHFSDSIHEDVQRRDFTINAMAYDPLNDVLVDDFQGQEDIKKKIITTVGDAKERFSEDALRIMRAVRFSAQLGFTCDEQTAAAIRNQAQDLGAISAERIRDEFVKLVDAQYAKDGMDMMRAYGLLDYTIPELLEGVGCEQGGIHDFDVWTHLVKSLEHGTKKEYPFYVKLAALFHDIGKPRTRRQNKGSNKKKWSFHGHEVVGARMTKKIMQRLKFSKDLTNKVTTLVRYHMFFSDPEAITLSAVRRMVKNVGTDLIWDLMDLRTCDRIGTGRPKEEPYRLRQYYAMIEEVMRDPISVGMLAINGDIMVGEMGLEPGPKMGWVLHALLEEVLDDPSLNNLEYQKERARELFELEDNELKKLGEAGREEKEKLEQEEIKKLHRKHKVK